VERWTIPSPSSGRYRLHVNHGGSGFWCMFDYVLCPGPECAGVEVYLSKGADASSVNWFPHLRKGMFAGIESACDQGIEWVFLRIEVQKIYSHPNDTTVRGCEYYGSSFIGSVLQTRGVRLPPESCA
jgi:hypothetical protein